MAEHDEQEETPDASTSFLDRMESTYGAEDQANADREDGVDEEDDAAGKEQEQGSTAASAAKDEGKDAAHTDAGTSTDSPDGDTVESTKETAAGDDDEHIDDEGDEPAPKNSEKDATDTTASAASADEDKEISAEAKRLLEQHGAKLSLDDVPEAARPLIKEKLRNIDAAFSRAQKENTAFRAKAAELASEAKYRDENPDMVIVEMLRKDPTIMEKVNDRLTALEADPDTASTAFDSAVTTSRKAAKDAVDADQQHYLGVIKRGDDVIALGKSLCSKAGMPWELAEDAIALAFTDLPKGKYDLTDEEIAAIVAKRAKVFNDSKRADRREQSKVDVKARTENRAKVAAPAKKAAEAVSPKPVAPKKRQVDWQDEDSRLAAILGSARTIAPGVR